MAKNGEHLCDLNKDQLCKLLGSDKLLVSSEAVVYKVNIMLYLPITASILTSIYLGNPAMGER